MKSKRNFIIFALAVIAVVAFAFYQFLSEKKIEARKVEKSLMLNVQKDQIQGIWLSTEENIVLKKTDGVWMIQEPLKEAADPIEVESFIEGLLAEKSSAIALSDSNIDWPVFGLDKPRAVIGIELSDGQKLTFAVSSKLNFQGDSFIRKNQDNQVLVSGPTWINRSEKKFFDFRIKRVFTAQKSDIESVIYRKGKLQISFIQKDQAWQIKEKPKAKPDQSKIRNFIADLTNLEVYAFFTETPPGPALAKQFGLDKPMVSVEFKLKDGTSIKYDLGIGKDKAHYLLISNLGRVARLNISDGNDMIQKSMESFL